MSRNQTRNIEIFKVGAGRVDEFGLHRQQRETEHVRRRPSESGPPEESLTKAEKSVQLVKEAQRKAKRRKRKAQHTE